MENRPMTEDLKPIERSDSQEQAQDKLNLTIATIQAQVKTTAARGEKLGQLESAVADLRAANRGVREAGVHAQTSSFSGAETELRNFVGKSADGRPTVRMYSDGTEPGLLDSLSTHGEWHERVKAAHSDFWLSTLCRSGKRHDFTSPEQNRSVSPKCYDRLQSVMSQAPDGIKRIFTEATANAGEEFVPTEIRIPEVIQALNQTTSQLVTGLFASTPMSNKTVVNPFFGAGITPYKYSAATADLPSRFTASTPTTDERARTAAGLACRVVLDADTEEDSIVDSRAILVQGIARSLALGIEDCLINGNTVATGDVDDYANWNPRSLWTGTMGTSADHRKCWIGLRHAAFDKSSLLDLSTTITYANILTMRGMLAPPHGMDGDLLMIMNEENYIQNLLALTQVATVDKYGPFASVLSGEVGRIGGMRVVVSHLLTNDMNASGKYDNVTTNLGGVIIVNRSRWKWGIRRGPRVEMDKDISRGVSNIVSTVRQTLYSLDSSTALNVVYGYNL